MDEPCSALDPISTGKIEDLMLELKENYSIVIVTHNMQQAARVSDMTAFLIVKLDDDEKHRQGRLVEYDVTEKIFTNPPTSAPRTTSPARWAEDDRRRQGPLPGGAREPEARALEGLDLVSAQLVRASAGGRAPGLELAELVVANDDVIDGRYLEVHQAILTLLATQALVAMTCA